MVSVSEAAAFMKARLAGASPPIGVFWYECEGSRNRVRGELREAAEGYHVLALTPVSGFDNANAMSADFVRLLEAARPMAEPDLASAERSGEAVAIVILTHTRLREPLLSSPVAVPQWFPYCGERIVAIPIADVASLTVVSLKAYADDIASLQRTLYEIDGLMLGRLVDVQAASKNDAMALFSAILGGHERPDEFLRVAERYHSTQKPSEFRAESHPRSLSVLGRVVCLVSATTPAAAPALAAALVRALRIDSEVSTIEAEPLIAVALRSTNKDLEGSRPQRQARNMLIALYAGAQLVTAYHHSGEYGEFPAAVIRAVVFDVRRALGAFKTALATQAA